MWFFKARPSAARDLLVDPILRVRSVGGQDSSLIDGYALLERVAMDGGGTRVIVLGQYPTRGEAEAAQAKCAA